MINFNSSFVMNDKPFDITRTLISSDFIAENIHALFPDSLFLDKDFKILGLSSNICQHLGYHNDALRGKSVSFFKPGGQLEQDLRDRLRKGYFNDETFQLSRHDGKTATYSVSGFYLGLLTDSSNLIVLRCINKAKIEEMEWMLGQTKSHIDNFIYRAAHDLRGPLATMQGLMNLLKGRKDNSEVDRFIDLLDMHGKKLDERLHHMVYLAKIDDEIVPPTLTLDFSKLETELRKTIEKNAFVDFLELTVLSKTPKVSGYNEIQIHSILTNILRYILSLPTCNVSSFIRVTATETLNGLTITLKADGFVTDPDVEKTLREIDGSRYTEILQSPKFTYLFAAQKVALLSKAFISLDQLGKDCEQITVWVPKTPIR
jgi:hypothetical protein